MRKLFMSLILLFCFICLNHKQIFARSLEDMVTELSNGVWISEKWESSELSRDLDNKSFVRKIIIINLPKEQIQQYFKLKSYINIETRHYLPIDPNVGRLFFSCDFTKQPTNNCDNDKIELLFENEPDPEPKPFILYNNGVMERTDNLYQGIKFIKIPFDQFDDYYKKYIEPGPPETVKASASAKATAIVKQSSDADKAQRDAEAKKRAIIERERQAAEAWMRAAEKMETPPLNPKINPK